MAKLRPARWIHGELARGRRHRADVDVGRIRSVSPITTRYMFMKCRAWLGTCFRGDPDFQQVSRDLAVAGRG
jgi:hypothetical protein